MNFDLTDDQRAIRDAVSAFAANEIAPHAAAWDRDHTFPVAVFKALGEIGIPANDRPPFAACDGLDRIEAETTDVSETSDLAAAIRAAERVRCVLNDA